MRILIADDSEHVRRGIVAIVSREANWSICGEAKDGADAIEKAAELRPDLLLLDVSLPDISGLEVARQVSEKAPGTKILIISNHDAGLLLPKALDSGAVGCVDKSRLSTDLLPFLRNIAATIRLPL